MEKKEIVKQLRRIARNTKSLPCYSCGHEHNCVVHGCEVLNEAMAMIEKIEERALKIGRWEMADMYDNGDICPFCGWDSGREPCDYRYCPNCGARMEG